MDRRHRPLFSRHLTAGIAAGALVLTACGASDSGPSAVGQASPTTAAADGATGPGTTPAPAGESEAESGSETEIERGEFFPDVLGAVSEQNDDGTWTFAVTISSPYDAPDQYADAWRVLGADGTEYGFRLLTHDHANEQPFTRSQSGITIPDDVTTVTVEGRDLVNGWGGVSIEHELAR